MKCQALILNIFSVYGNIRYVVYEIMFTSQSGSYISSWLSGDNYGSVSEISCMTLNHRLLNTVINELLIKYCSVLRLTAWTVVVLQGQMLYGALH